jgi:26S proteasome regulatory subunit N12
MARLANRITVRATPVRSEAAWPSKREAPAPSPAWLIIKLSIQFYNHIRAYIRTFTPIKEYTMSEHELKNILRKLKSSKDYDTSSSLLSKAKITLLKLNALTPTPKTPKTVLLTAREVYEAGAIISIKNRDPDAFTRYVHQLQPFYDLPSDVLPAEKSERSRITGLYLLLLLTKGDYAAFHTELEGLEAGAGFDGNGGDVEADRYISYPVKLERWLMEGSYDQVWKAMASREVPSEEYGVFSEV